MAQITISSTSQTGRDQSVQSNFNELYAPRAAWATYTTTATPASGSFTTVSTSGSQVTSGKTVHFRLQTTITTAGTGTSPVSITLPASANAASLVNGATASGAVLAKLASASKNVSVTLASITDGTVITVSGTYESQ